MVLKYPSQTDQKWSYTLTAVAGSFSSPVIIPAYATRIGAYVFPGIGGSAVLQFTGDDEETVENDPGSVRWLDWDIGTVTSAKACAALGAMTALRLGATAVDATARIVGHKDTIRR